MISLGCFLLYFLRRSLLLNLELTFLLERLPCDFLAGPTGTYLHATLSHGSWAYRHMPPRHTFTWVLGLWTRPLARATSTLPAEPATQPQISVSQKIAFVLILLVY